MERAEALEQLVRPRPRVAIAVDVLDAAPAPGVGTGDDLARMDAELAGRADG
ncbi:MAG: hypothetical protein R2939_12800 [Kofleriaceae bacterium]